MIGTAACQGVWHKQICTSLCNRRLCSESFVSHLTDSDIEIAAMDDFALKKRHRYGTVLINAKTGNVVDMLESREKEDVINR